MIANIGDLVVLNPDYDGAIPTRSLPERILRVDSMKVYSNWPEWCRTRTMYMLTYLHNGGGIEISDIELRTAFSVHKTREEIVAERMLA